MTPPAPRNSKSTPQGGKPPCGVLFAKEKEDRIGGERLGTEDFKKVADK